MRLFAPLLVMRPCYTVDIACFDNIMTIVKTSDIASAGLYRYMQWTRDLK